MKELKESKEFQLISNIFTAFNRLTEYQLIYLISLKTADELIQKELLPLTYDRAIEELKLRNALVRKSY